MLLRHQDFHRLLFVLLLPVPLLLPQLFLILLLLFLLPELIFELLLQNVRLLLPFRKLLRLRGF